MHQVILITRGRCTNSCIEDWGRGEGGTKRCRPPALRREPALGSPGKGVAPTTTHPGSLSQPRAGRPQWDQERRQWLLGQAQKERMPDADAALCAFPLLPLLLPLPLHCHLGGQAAPGKGEEEAVSHHPHSFPHRGPQGRERMGVR